MMSYVSLLFQLPSAWFVAILSEWLDMPSVGMLDTAMSSKTHRSQFLNSLQNMRSTSIDRFSDGRDGICFRRDGNGGKWTGCWWRWLSIRGIYVERIVLRGNAVRSVLVIPSMQKVVALVLKDDDLEYLVRNCPSLRSIKLSSVFSRETHVGLRILTKLHQSLEEFSLYRFSNIHQPEEYYTETAAALIDVFRQCSRLHKVSLTDDALHSVNVEELIPHGHLFHQLEFRDEGRTAADTRAISKLLVNCCNLRKLRYHQISIEEQDSLFHTTARQSCPLLEELEILSTSFNRQQQIGGAGVGMFTFIHRNCGHLRKLTMSNCEVTTSILRSIAGMESLKELTLGQCEGLTDADMAVLATMKLVNLRISEEAYQRESDVDIDVGELTGASLQSFVGSDISQTLENFDLSVYDYTIPMDDVQMATALASCHNLKTVCVSFFCGCIFGRHGLDGLQAMATGCPLLTDVSLWLTVPGLHCLGTHFPNLKKCNVYNWREAGPVPEGFPSIEELQTLYPAVTWKYGY
jgi:hypothetical protein